MAFLDGSTITVDAILTKHGRSKLASGGGLDIRKFSLGDDGVNYGLYNVNHPSGSNFYGQAITDMPQLEAVTDDYANLKYHLMTMDRNKVFLPKIIMDPETGPITIDRQGPAGGKTISFKTRNWGPEKYALRATDSTGLILNHAPNLTSQGGRKRRYHPLQDLPDDVVFGPVESFELQAEPILEKKEGAVIVYGMSSGATAAFRYVLEKNIRQLPDVSS